METDFYKCGIYEGQSLKMTLAYDGSNYAGWQVQPGKATIQGSLENAIASVCRERVRVTGSGRTDAGVHAFGQVASLRLISWKSSLKSLRLALNSNLPDDISIVDIVAVENDFHAIRDALSKRYRYQIYVSDYRSPFGSRYHWNLSGKFDLNGMRSAAAFLRGTFDFASFQATGSNRKTTVRSVHDLQIDSAPVSLSEFEHCECRFLSAGGFSLSPDAAANGWVVKIEVEANGFLYNMVRNIVGTLVQVARGKRCPDWVCKVRDARDRTKAGPTAPANGLFLLRVNY